MKKTLPPSRTAPQFVVRFPDEWMRDRIKRDADEQGRSMNAQILFMLQRYFDELDKGVSQLEAARTMGGAFSPAVQEAIAAASAQAAEEASKKAVRETIEEFQRELRKMMKTPHKPSL